MRTVVDIWNLLPDLLVKSEIILCSIFKRHLDGHLNRQCIGGYSEQMAVVQYIDGQEGQHEQCGSKDLFLCCVLP